MARKNVNQSYGESKQYFIPMEVTEETIEAYGLNRDKVIWKLVGNRKTRVYMVPATEEQYRAYIRDQWAEQKSRSRESRCTVRGKSGRLIRCPDSRKCEGCERYSEVCKEENRPASLDALAQMGAEPDSGGSTEDGVVFQATLEYFIALLGEIDPCYGQIFEMLYDQETQAEIARELGMPEDKVSEEVKKIRKILRPIVKELQDR